MIRLLSAALMILASGASLAQSKAKGSDAFIAQSKAAAVSDLKDPESARFRKLKVIRTDSGLRLLCGEINAKNSYGAYIGYRPFVSGTDGFVVVPSEDSEIQALRELYGQRCGF